MNRAEDFMFTREYPAFGMCMCKICGRTYRVEGKDQERGYVRSQMEKVRVLMLKHLETEHPKLFEDPEKPTEGKLVEVQSVRQRPEEGFRRYFVDDGAKSSMELWIWYATDHTSMIGFQLICYGTAITWTKESFSVRRIDEGGGAGSMKMTPTLGAGVEVVPSDFVPAFKQRAREIDPLLVRFIAEKLEEKSSN